MVQHEDGKLNYNVGSTTRWSCSNRAVKPGDPIYFWRVGKQPGRGVVAKARAFSKVLSGEHWNTSKKGAKYSYVWIEFEDIRDRMDDPYLPASKLTELWPQLQNWSPQQSGTEIEPQVRIPFHNLWKRDRINPINMIFYGPPGTGKTYKLKEECFPRYTGGSENISRTERLQNTLDKMGWRDVIAVTLLEIGKPQRVPDIVKHEYVQIKAKLMGQRTTRIDQGVWSMLQIHTAHNCSNVKVATRHEPLWFWKNDDSSWWFAEDAVETDSLIVDYLQQLQQPEDELSTVVKRYSFVTFHQSL